MSLYHKIKAMTFYSTYETDKQETHKQNLEIRLRKTFQKLRGKYETFDQKAKTLTQLMAQITRITYSAGDRNWSICPDKIVIRNFRIS